MSDVLSLFLDDPDPEDRVLPRPASVRLTRTEADRLMGLPDPPDHFHRSDEPPLPFLVGCGCAADPVRLMRPPLAER